MIDLSFILTGTCDIPADHGYHLYAAVSRLLSSMHEPNGIGVHPIRGRLIGDRRMQICDFSRLTIRVAPERIADLLPLAGKQLNIGRQPVRVGVPQVYALSAATALRSRLVTIKVSGDRAAPHPPDETEFLAAARRQLDALNVSPEAQLTVGKRRTLRVKDKEVVGYEVLASELTAHESISLQESGLGGRRHMGCGIFVRFNPRAQEANDG
ncbi:MAG TPA: type I-MYXAN CRISPR-associated protein Cas6/Cmx6 [Pirellulales bacterium]|nr:type I-MYXAN CRISPR-associated protein Cas6/Cmx6 [Pirellulales bacterium]